MDTQSDLRSHKPVVLILLLFTIILVLGVVLPSSGAGQEADSFIVTAVDMETAVQAVTQVGGAITHELGIIDAVGATLTPAQKTRLERIEGVTQIWANESVVTAGQSDTLRDEFETRSYSNNDGSQIWGSDWVEFGDYGGARYGRIKVHYFRFLLMERPGGRIERRADLAGVQSALLSFDYRRKEKLGNRYVALEISPDGGAT